MPERDTALLSIGFASPCWPSTGAPNGIITYVSNIEAALRAQGHKVAILSLLPAAGQSELPVFDVEATHLRRSLPRRLLDSMHYRLSPLRAGHSIFRRAVVATAWLMHRQCGLDVLEMEESFGTAAAVQRAMPIPVCVRLHGPWFLTGGADLDPGSSEFRDRVADEGRALSAATLVSAPAHDVLEQVRAYYQLPLEDAEIIPNPVTAPPAAARWRLESCDRRRILFVGRFERLKGADLILEAFARVLLRFPEARLCLAGADGRISAGGRQLQLEEWVRERLTGALEAGKVEWLGVQTPAAVAALRCRALLTVVPSRYETFSYTVAEAMAQGCPVVAAEVGGMRDLITHGETGIFHRPGDAAHLAERIVALMEHPEWAAAMGERARAFAEAQLRPDRVAVRQVAFYRKAMARVMSQARNRLPGH